MTTLPEFQGHKDADCEWMNTGTELIQMHS